MKGRKIRSLELIILEIKKKKNVGKGKKRERK